MSLFARIPTKVTAERFSKQHLTLAFAAVAATGLGLGIAFTTTTSAPAMTALHTSPGRVIYLPSAAEQDATSEQAMLRMSGKIHAQLMANAAAAVAAHNAHLAHLTILRQRAAAARQAVLDAQRSQQQPASSSPAPSGPGIYSYSALENLWVQAGGSPAHEATAACIAEHESGGNPTAVSPTDDWGLWQIHGAGSVAFNPAWNAARAVAMSADGTDWSQWTTAPMCGV